MRRLVPVLVAILAIIGIADSAYLTYLHFQEVLAVSPTAGFCSFAAGSCETISQSKQGSILGFPTGLLGALYYLLVLGATLFRLHRGRWPVPMILPYILVAGLAFSGYLLYTMLYVLGVPCPYCLAAHSANVLVAVLYVISRHLDRPEQMRRGRWAINAR